MAVFVTDGFWRKSLAGVRALGRAGVNVVCGEATPFATALFSRYAKKRVLYPHPSTVEPFISRVVEICSTHSIRVVLPMEEETLLTLLECRDRIPAEIPFSSPDVIRGVRDKANIIDHARTLGLPTPMTWTPKTREDLEQVLTNSLGPWILKPRIGSGSVGVQSVDSPIRLTTAWEARSESMVIQEKIPQGGRAIGVSCLYDRNGRRVAHFTHERLRSYPVKGGPSTFRRSIRHPRAEEMAFRLLEGLGWYGVAMVEFLEDPRSNDPVLLEVNPRFWGSLHLAVRAGVDFPTLLYRMGCGEDVPPVRDYQLGVTARWLLPGDLLHFASQRKYGQLARSLRSGPKGGYDILSRDDFFPAIGRVLSALSLAPGGTFRNYANLNRGFGERG